MKIVGKIHNQLKINKLPPPIGAIKNITSDVNRTFTFMRGASRHWLVLKFPCYIRPRPFVAGFIMCILISEI